MLMMKMMMMMIQDDERLFSEGRPHAVLNSCCLTIVPEEGEREREKSEQELCKDHDSCTGSSAAGLSFCCV